MTNDLRPDARGCRETVFTEIARVNMWGNRESLSGPGSTRERALAIREPLCDLMRRWGVRSLLDAPCGDYHWMRSLELPLETYIGMDIVPELIDRNQSAYGRVGARFVVGDLISDALPRVDLILCRDALVHFPISEIHSALANFKRSGSTWLLTTHFVGDRANEDIRLGDWRPLNLERPPFDLPRPVDAVDEMLRGEAQQWSDKRLALWRLADLPTFA
jgi:methyltransferase family protein